MKYLRVLQDETAYDTFKNSTEYITPNICYLQSSGGIRRKLRLPPPPPVALCDVAYWDGSSVKTTPYSKWSTSLGTPVGVVVIPEGFAPDGKPRIISLKYVGKNGAASSTNVGIEWGKYGTDTSLTNFTGVPKTDNAGSTSTSSSSYGYLPSDKFTGTTSYVDSKAKYYNSTSYMIPSPYLNDGPNPEYYKEISGNNALSDFNGLSNTEVLVGLGTSYTAANAAYKYNDGVSNLQWYLPAMGELGYIMPRFNEINNVITALGGIIIHTEAGNDSHWSSSESSSMNAYYLMPSYGKVENYNGNWDKDGPYDVRPFAML